MEYSDYLAGLRRHAAHAALTPYAVLREANGRDYEVVCLTVEGPRWLVVTAGFHGEEPAGPLTLLEHFAELAALARARGVGLRVYPCVNPSGFEAGTRYNASGERPNNDFLRYQLPDGRWVGELLPGMEPVRHELHAGIPKETQALRAELERHPPPAAALDLHQDDYVKECLTYAYTFGPPAPYRALMREASAHADVAANRRVDEHHHADAHGLIHAHDGSVTDYYFRRGVQHTACLETTTVLPMPRAHAVNLVWLRGFVELVARG